MDNFKIVYKILQALEESMDAEEPDLRKIMPEHLKVSPQRWAYIMRMLYPEFAT